MQFFAEIRMEVADHDADVIMQFSDVVMERFKGTAIKIKYIEVHPEGAIRKEQK